MISFAAKSGSDGLDRDDLRNALSHALLRVVEYQDQGFLDDLKENRSRAQAQVMEAVSRERKVVYEAVQNALAPKLLAAMARNFIILFNRLSLTSMVRIGMECLGNYSNHFTEKSAVALKYEEL